MGIEAKSAKPSSRAAPCLRKGRNGFIRESFDLRRVSSQAVFRFQSQGAGLSMYVENFVMIIGFTTLQRQNCLLVSEKVIPKLRL